MFFLKILKMQPNFLLGSSLRHLIWICRETELPKYREYGSRIKKRKGSTESLIFQNKRTKAASKMKSHHFFLSCLPVESTGLAKTPTNVFLDLQSHPASVTTVIPSLNLPPGAGNLLIVKVIADLWNSVSFPSIAGSGKSIFMGEVMDKTLCPNKGWW